MHAEALPCASTSPCLSTAVPHTALSNPQHGQGTPPGTTPATKSLQLPSAHAQHRPSPGLHAQRGAVCPVLLSTGPAQGSRDIVLSLDLQLAPKGSSATSWPAPLGSHARAQDVSQHTSSSGNRPLRPRAQDISCRPPARSCTPGVVQCHSARGAGQGGRVVTATRRLAARTLLTSQCSSSACMTAGSYSPSEKCVGSMGIEGSCFQFWAS